MRRPVVSLLSAVADPGLIACILFSIACIACTVGVTTFPQPVRQWLAMPNRPDLHSCVGLQGSVHYWLLFQNEVCSLGWTGLSHVATRP